MEYDKLFHNEKVVVKLRGGAELVPAIRAAIIMALTERRDVELEHNGHVVRIEPVEIIDKYFQDATKD